MCIYTYSMKRRRRIRYHSRTTITKALKELPVYYRYHIKTKLVLGRGLKMVRYQTFIKKRNQSQKRKEQKRKEI